MLILFLGILFQFSETVVVNYVLFNVKAYDEREELVGDLKKDDFELYVDLNKVKIEHFSKVSSEPQSILIMLDSSGSMAVGDLWEKVSVLIKNIGNFIKEKDEVGFFIFQSDSFRLIKSFDSNIKIEDLLKEIKPWGKTALYDSLILSKIYLERRKNKDKRIILITDTHDNSSKEDPQKVISALIKTKYPCHIFALKQTEKEPLEIDFLKNLSIYTNGSIHIIDSIYEIEKEVEKCFDSFSKEYLIGFEPARKSKESFHKIIIKAKKKGLKIVSRNSYYGRAPKSL